MSHPFSTRRRWMAIAMAFSLVLAACGSDDDESSSASASESSESASASDSASASGSASEPAEEAEESTDEGDEAMEDDASGVTYPLTITDAAGTEFTFDEPPVVGCAWYGCTESAAEMGIPLEAALLTSAEVDSVFYSPVAPPRNLIEDFTNPEEWAATDVNLIVTRLPANPSTEALNEQVAPVFYLHYPAFAGFEEGTSDLTGLEAYYENYRLLGQIFGDPAAGDAAIDTFETFIANLTEAVPADRADTTVSVMFDGDGYLILGPTNPFCDTLVQVGLGTCVGEMAGAQINAEQFLSYDPDYIVYGGFGGQYEDRDDPIFPQLSAVQSGQIYNADGNRHYCCSTRGLMASIQEFAAKTLPDSGIPVPPADHNTFDPSTSPLVTG